MKHMLNTLFVTTENAYLSLDGENVVVSENQIELGRFPLHTLSAIISFSYRGATPTLMGACSERNVDMVFCSPRGKFLARSAGISGGNVLLRREQYRIADDSTRSNEIAKRMIFGKVFNARWNIERVKRDHGQRIDIDHFKEISTSIKNTLPEIMKARNSGELRGLEGTAASAYFSLFNDMILRNKEDFAFTSRNRRPPTDRINALLSFAYSLLSHDCASALESVGLDSYVGFLHTDRPGRESLALDLMEELRPCIADRFILTLINRQIIQPSDFIIEEGGAVRLEKDARSVFLKAWQERKQEIITHPYLDEKIPWGLVPYVQALLLARFIRGDIEAYPPFLWK